MKYVIHTYPKRLWYVNGYLIPDMIRQGIKKDDILVINDKNKNGNLKAFILSCELLNESCWHLQDDILISKDFKTKTEVLGRLDRIVCGFCHYDFNDGATLCTGFTTSIFMYMSFPCIFIPVRYLKEFVNWFYLPTTQIKNKKEIEENKNDDMLFYRYMNELHKHDEIYNCKVCLVDHIDYLLGGSSINPRDHIVRATYWYEDERNIELERKLKNYDKNKSDLSK